MAPTAATGVRPLSRASSPAGSDEGASREPPAGGFAEGASGEPPTDGSAEGASAREESSQGAGEEISEDVSGSEGSGGAGDSQGAGGELGTTGSSDPEGTEGGDSGAPGEPGEGRDASTTTSAPFRFFGATSIWNQELSANAPLDPKSTEMVDALAEEVLGEEQAGSGPWINTTSYSVPVYTVSASQETVRVALDGAHPMPALQAAWNAVPLPGEAKPARGTDGLLVVWQPSTNRLWEFWRLRRVGGEWSASWGGAMQNVSTSLGVFGPEAFPGATAAWGASASALSLVGGLISLEDLERGEINHALSMSLPNIRSGIYASPAQRSDGQSGNALALPEGAHLRLDPKLDLASLHLPRLTLMIAQAAQRYGIYVKDGAKNVTFDAQDPLPTGTEPYAGPGGYFGGESPRALLATFPWSHLQLLQMQLYSNS